MNDDQIFGFDPKRYHDERFAKIEQQGGFTAVPWTTPGLKVTRLRLISDPGFPLWDISYCHGEVDGQVVDVQLPFYQIPKMNIKGFIIQEAIRDNVHAKRLGILDCISRFQ